MRSVLSSALFCCIASIFPFRLRFRFRFRFRFGLWLRFWFRLGFGLRFWLGFWSRCLYTVTILINSSKLAIVGSTFRIYRRSFAWLTPLCFFRKIKILRALITIWRVCSSVCADCYFIILLLICFSTKLFVFWACPSKSRIFTISCKQKWIVYFKSILDFLSNNACKPTA